MEGQNENSEEQLSCGAGTKRSQRYFLELYEWVEQAAQVVVLVVLLFTFVARTSVVSGTSMVQTLQHGDMLIVSRVAYRPHRGDVVVVTKPNFENEPIVKRIIATEGQSVDIDFDAGVVYVNATPLEEPYTNTPTNRRYDTEFPLTVPPGEVFVLGDNRNGSLDSRASAIGLIDARYILGKAVWRLLPFRAFGKL